ncbi:hypothetical protein [Flavobacterium sp.]|uniref:hypothetical protein n=1 Tax=Flavobacterium sp. TaxID=239 RepID=UPI00248A76B5|nr:hypothetical protein [Flavobacterium sp.]MDI1316268.1 hypothetical protein [Flavobacterium sp.]
MQPKLFNVFEDKRRTANNNKIIYKFMKKLVFGLITTLFMSINANAQKPSLSDVVCGPGQHATISFEFNTLRFHRASAGCTRRFSICSDGEWIIECVDNRRLASYNPVKDSATVLVEISNDGNTALLRFPIEIKSLPHFKEEDFSNFGFDNDYKLTKDFVIAKGEYAPKFTDREITVTVNLR